MTQSTAVLFDLDDTLYLEEDYFRGGFQVVADELSSRGYDGEGDVASYLLSLHHENRDRVLDRAANILGFPPGWVGDLVDTFRSHEPTIGLSPEVPEVLMGLRQRSVSLGIVTDGHGDVQRRKIASLGVEHLVDVVVVADDFGRSAWKPDPSPMLRCLRQLGVPTRAATFVGDHPDRDVLGARNAGLTCVRIRRPGGYFSAIPTPEGAGRWSEIANLTELDGALRALG
jgi:putative hydrolase of the HAD superfamily